MQNFFKIKPEVIILLTMVLWINCATKSFYYKYGEYTCTIHGSAKLRVMNLIDALYHNIVDNETHHQKYDTYELFLKVKKFVCQQVDTNKDKQITNHEAFNLGLNELMIVYQTQGFEKDAPPADSVANQ